MNPVRRRTRARELAVQFLYYLDLRGMDALEELDAFLAHHTKGSELKGEEEVAAYARELIEGVAGDTDNLNDWIEAIAENWRLDRMAHVDRNVLRMAVYELIHKPEVPFKVVINEGIDIAKRFSTSQSGSFVNGILDRARILIHEVRESGDELRPPTAEKGPRPAAEDPV